MTAPVLVAVDPRRDDPAPLALGLRLTRIADAPLLLAAACPESEQAETEDALRRAEAQLRDVPGPIPPIDVRAIDAKGTPAAALHRVAAGESPLLMVIGSSSRGELGRVSPGAVTDRLLHGSPCPVAVAPRGLALEAAGDSFLRVGCAYVDAPDAQAALGAASAIARKAGAHLRVFVVMRAAEPHAMGVPMTAGFDHEAPRRREGEAQLQHGLDAAGAGASGELLDGDPPVALAAAATDFDLLVCGSRGHGPLNTLFLGGTSHALVRRAACPVLIVPRGTEDALAEACRASPDGAARS